MPRWRRWSGVSLGYQSKGISWYSAVTGRRCTMRTKTLCPVHLISSILVLNSGRNLLPLMTRKRAWSCCSVVAFNWCPRNPCITVLVSRTRRMAFEIAPCDTPVIPDISFWESSRPEDSTIISITAGQILVGIIAILVWNGDLHTAKTHTWMCSTQMWYTASGAFREISTPMKKGWRGLSPDLNLTPLAAFLLFCRVQWGKKSEKADGLVHIVRGLLLKLTKILWRSWLCMDRHIYD